MGEVMDIIRDIFTNNMPLSTHRISVEITSYENLLHIWKHWKRTKQLNIQTHDDIMLKNFFEFHLNDPYHIIFVAGKNMEQYLLMCRIHQQYLNIISPLHMRHHGKSLVVIYK